MSSGGGNSTTTTRVDYPPWLEAPMRDNIARANTLADQMGEAGYQSYDPSARIAGMNDLQMNAMQNARDSVGQWTPFLNRSALSAGQANTLALQAGGMPANAAYAGPSALVQAGRLSNTDLSGYMNPYTDMVTKNALANLEDTRQVQQTGNADAAMRAKAFGGSRYGVVEAQTNAAFGKQAGELALNSAQSNFLNAQNQATNDINRNMQGQLANQGAWNQMNQFNAGLAMQGDLAYRGLGLDAARLLQSGAGLDADLASQWQSLNSNDLNNLLTAGNQLQDQDQLGRDFAYQEWLNQRNFPIDLLNLRFSSVNNTPYKSPTASSSPINRNRVGGFLGGAATGAMAGSFIPGIGTVAGAIGGGLLGAFG